MDISTINAAYASLRFIRDSLSIALDAKVDEKTRAKIHEAMGQITSLQDGLFQAQQQLFALIQQNEELRKSVASMNSWKIRAATYNLIQAAGGGLVYEFKDNPKHYACPSCFEQSRISILQDTRTYERLWDCPVCKASFKLEPTKGKGYRA